MRKDQIDFMLCPGAVRVVRSLAVVFAAIEIAQISIF